MRSAGLFLAGASMGLDFWAMVLQSLALFVAALVMLAVAVVLMVAGEHQ